MGLNWNGIVNNVEHAITITEQDISKAVGVVGKTLNAGIKFFIKVEPTAVSLISPFFPEAGVILGIAYKYANQVQMDVNATGADKLAKVQNVIMDAALPALAQGLQAAGKTFNYAEAGATVTAIINAVVAENNAQAKLTALIGTAASTGTFPDPAAIQAAYAEVSAATAAVTHAASMFQATIATVKAAA